MVTVVDAVNLLERLLRRRISSSSAAKRWRTTSAPLVDLLVEQIEFADVIVLNKVDDASPAQREAARKIIRALNPEADLIEANHSRVPFDRILDTGRFDFEARRSASALVQGTLRLRRSCAGDGGIRRHQLRLSRAPAVRTRKVRQVRREPWPGVIRAKGHFWLATRPQWLGEISQAGSITRTEALGFWWASVPAERWPDDPFWRKRLRENWNDIYGDRRQEIVFIGTGMDKEFALRTRLDACLVPGKPADERHGMGEACGPLSGLAPRGRADRGTQMTNVVRFVPKSDLRAAAPHP